MADVTRNYDHLFKILIVGESGVGKSSILLRFTDDEFNEKQLSTIGVDFKVKYMSLSGKRLKLAVWDTAGQERFRTLTSSYYRGAQGVILVYDTSNRDTFESLGSWLEEVRKYSTNAEAVKMLVANKIDVDRGEVERREGEKFAFENCMLFIETSAKTKQGIMHAFEELVQKIVDTPSLLSNTAPLSVSRQLSGRPGSGDDGGCSC
eukprot:GHVS01029452.1.p1 GENE.GHVS01029452.1~~GHVS01029452.1.p1  ORF type:complete len:206 (+),score=30.87 GHVS01029452.1:373-990(+)